MSYLTLENLSKAYTKDGGLVVNRLNLEIDKKEFIVLLGPSGCGKTTTIRMISGLEDVTEGNIILDGENIIHKPIQQRGISMIFQSYAIWPHMTVYDNIAYPLKLKKMSKDEIERTVNEVAEIAEIKPFLDRYPSQLSGGQKQRTAVARAIAIKPKIFLMDEPLSNLDAKLRVSVRTDLRDIHNKLEATTIFVTHDQSEAMSLADRIVVMHDGKIEQIGTPNQVYHRSETKFVASFIGSPPTNFITCTVIEKGSTLYLKHDLFEKELSTDYGEKLKRHIDKTVLLGIRPEKFQVMLDKQKALFSAQVEISEPQGSHTIIVCRPLGIEFKMVTSIYLDIKPKTVVYIDFREKDVLIFDCITERLIN